MTTNTLIENSAIKAYEHALQETRQRLANNPALLAIVAPEADPVFLEFFLIYFNALGVSMTQPVDGWINRAGEKCQQIGFSELGQALCLHATHEAGHHQMMIDDTHTLINRWNARRQPQLSADEFLSHPIPEGVRNYIKLHEDTIASDAPFGQIAIELEIEGLSVRIGPILIQQCIKVLGANVIEGLSFLEEHIALDVSHTKFNEKQLDKFLQQHPECLDSLINAGQKALEAYGKFLSDCVRLAKAKADSITR